jgi:hypothetical protein
MRKDEVISQDIEQRFNTRNCRLEAQFMRFTRQSQLQQKSIPCIHTRNLFKQTIPSGAQPTFPSSRMLRILVQRPGSWSACIEGGALLDDTRIDQCKPSAAHLPPGLGGGEGALSSLQSLQRLQCKQARRTNLNRPCSREHEK